jgi:hypothetical protein
MSAPRVGSWLVFGLGASLWFGLLTNWSWASVAANGFHSVLAFTIGGVTLVRPLRRFLGAAEISRWAGAIALSAGCVAVMGPILMLAPPLTLAAVFGADEIVHQKTVQVTPSHDGAWFAVVRYRGVGAYAPGAGKLVITGRHRLIPFMECDVAGPIGTSLGEGEGPFVRWNDQAQIEMKGQDVVLGRPGTRFEWPFVVPVVQAIGTWSAARIDFGGEGDEPVPAACQKWGVWNVRPGMMVSSVARLDPDVAYRRQIGPETYLWDVVLWKQRSADSIDEPQLVQWRFGFEGTLVTKSPRRSARVEAMRLSAGAVRLGPDGSPNRGVPVLQRVYEAWGPPTRSLNVKWSRPVAESWSPHAQRADIWASVDRQNRPLMDT